MTPENLTRRTIGFNAPVRAPDESAGHPERGRRRGVAEAGGVEGSTDTIPVLRAPVAASRPRTATAVLPLYRAPRRAHRRPALRNEPVTWLVATATALFGLAAVLLLVSLSVPAVDASLVDNPTPGVKPIIVAPTSAPPVAPPVATTPEPEPEPEPQPRGENDRSDRRADESTLAPSVPDVPLSDDIVDRYVPRGVLPSW